MPHLTKTRFALVLDCPTKLYYNENKQYANQSLEDSFLAELSKGGFQVGALARCYYKGGIRINEVDYEQASLKTLELLRQENAIIFEAAFMFEHFFIRADIIEKVGNTINLIEVKAKSFKPSKDKFLNNKQEISPKWEEYLFDVAFQSWVISNSFISNNLSFNINSHLLLVNKEAFATVDGLNQRFFFNKNTRGIEVDDLIINQPEQLGDKILVLLNVNDEVKQIHEERYDEGSFKDKVYQYGQSLFNNKKIITPVSKNCKTCEFRNVENVPERFDGYKECWQHVAGFKENDFTKPLVYDVWDFRKADEFIRLKKYFLTDLDRNDLIPKTERVQVAPGMSRVDRQEIQIIKFKQHDNSAFVLVSDLKKEMGQWVYPLHMIDFETTAVALPFYKNMRPYETVAFQFSHHIMHEDGRIEHANEWINTQRGFFPNFEFVRQLKKCLEKDDGSVFRYAAHENTVLNCIYEQLENSSEHDKRGLQNFIRTITYENKIGWVGDRNMIDLCDAIKKYYYNPLAGGSNSIKYILPAILNSSKFLQNKYVQPIYGTSKIGSKNFKNHKWINIENGNIINPYKLLAPIFSTNDDSILDNTLLDEEAGIQDGGAAMTAYAMMQFTRMHDEELEAVKKALLKYCELDTMAMVMIIEEFKNLCA